MNRRKKINYAWVDDIGEPENVTVEDVRFWDFILQNYVYMNNRKKVIGWPKRTIFQAIKDFFVSISTQKTIYKIRMDRWQEQWISDGEKAIEKYKEKQK